MSGKGDTPRPKSVSEDEFAARWDAIFKPKGESPETPDNEELSDER